MTARVDAGNSSPSASGVTAGNEFAGSQDERKEKASAPILGALKRAEDHFNSWDASCHAIDDIYSRQGASYERLLELAAGSGWTDAQLDLFWASSEVLKPAVLARPPIPAIAPLFKDGGKVKVTTAEVLERATLSTFKRTGIADVMEAVRDDLIFAARGVMWLRYETDNGKRVCVEHLDRKDFLHEPARKWSEVGWVAARFWLDRDTLKKRFGLSEEKLDEIKFQQHRDDDKREDGRAMSAKAPVWEVWHRANKRVYWVTDGLDVYLDDDKPHLTLEGFFPCPRPAYGTLQRRSLIPVPDFERFATHFAKINTLTARIYLLLDQVKMKGLIPGGGDVADALEQVLRSEDDSIVVQVPGAAMLMDGAGNFVQWLPLQELAAAIQGLIEARRQLIDDFYQLSGISDIMRGATEAEETLGAQQMKAQFGSVRVRCKIDEMQRIAADAVKIASEIISQHFDAKTLLDMAQMELPTRAEIKKRIKQIEDAAEKELKALSKRAEEMAAQSAEPVDPAQVQAMLQQEQQAILAKYGPMLEEAEGLVPIDDVIDLLRDDKARSFAFEIETDSTILTDEVAEKQSRAEFMTAFTGASQALMSLAGLGEQGAKLAGEMFKFALAPYRAGRQMNAAIDAFIDAAPSMAAAMQPGDDGGLAEAQGKLAEAEMEKARAAMAKVEADGMLRQVEQQRKMAELQQKAQADQAKWAADAEKLRQANRDSEAKLAKTQAEVDNLNAQTAAILDKLGIDWARLNLDASKAASEDLARQNDQAMRADGQAFDQQARVSDQQRTAECDQVEDQFREADRADRLQQETTNG
jgi:hypothetical protein